MTDDTALPVLPLRNTVLYPYVMMPVAVQRPLSVAAVEAALESEDKTLAVVPQKDASVDRPGKDDLPSTGTKAVIKRMARSESAIEMLLQGVERIDLGDFEQTEPYLKAEVTVAPVAEDAGTEVEALKRELIDLGRQIQEGTQPNLQMDFSQLAAQIEDPMHLVYLLAMMANLDVNKGQQLLNASRQLDAMRLLHGFLSHEVQVLSVQQQIASQVQSEMGKEQREYVLRQQLRAIQEELGESSPEHAEASELRQRLEEADLPEHARKEAERELGRLESLPAAAPDYQVTRTHLELILELPWKKFTTDNLDLNRAREILDEDHYSLQEIKERILEHLAVMKLNPEAHAPILCFVGPPGVGKTSLGQSIARALGREFERFSLGGMHDEAELRGHRRTYIGAMPGRIIQAIRRAEVHNPLLMLDEVDKLGRDFRGDPAAALLEILDPAQNSQFRDNYLDLTFDLSRVFFITTCNTTDTVPRPLLDRMETLRLSGYSDEEKLQIARRYLLPRQRKESGLNDEQLTIPDETIQTIISRYTREAGVRELERMLGRVCRKLALKFAEGQTKPVTVHPDDLPDLLGAQRFRIEQARKKLSPGVATGMAWTETGGDILYIEAIELPEEDKLTLTGQLGNVMQESAGAARSYVISQSEVLGIQRPRAGVHLHVPAGAIPKDGPSAGATMLAALASLYTRHPVRSDTAMTGEITLSGLILPVGGVKEKVLAARRADIRRIILPKENEKDLRDVPANVREEMEFVFAERAEDVLTAAIPALAERLQPTGAAS